MFKNHVVSNHASGYELRNLFCRSREEYAAMDTDDLVREFLITSKRLRKLKELEKMLLSEDLSSAYLQYCTGGDKRAEKSIDNIVTIAIRVDDYLWARLFIRDALADRNIAIATDGLFDDAEEAKVNDVEEIKINDVEEVKVEEAKQAQPEEDIID
jgi:hypothetical protein